jgi:hypothetical protein
VGSTGASRSPSPNATQKNRGMETSAHSPHSNSSSSPPPSPEKFEWSPSDSAPAAAAGGFGSNYAFSMSQPQPRTPGYTSISYAGSSKTTSKSPFRPMSLSQTSNISPDLEFDQRRGLSQGTNSPFHSVNKSPFPFSSNSASRKSGGSSKSPFRTIGAGAGSSGDTRTSRLAGQVTQDAAANRGRKRKVSVVTAPAKQVKKRRMKIVMDSFSQ